MGQLFVTTSMADERDDAVPTAAPTAAAAAAAADDTSGGDGSDDPMSQATTKRKKKPKKKTTSKKGKGKRDKVDRSVKWWHQLVSLEAFMFYALVAVLVSTGLAHLGYRGRESVVGIDLGTTFSVVAVRRNDGSVEVIPNKLGKNTTPSVVSYLRNGRVLVGADAVAVQEEQFRRTIYNAKRFIGKRFDDESVEQDVADHPFRVLAGPPRGKVELGDSNIYFDVKNNKVSPRLVSPEEVGREIIKTLMGDVKRHLGHSQVRRRVLSTNQPASVPASMLLLACLGECFAHACC